MKFQYAITTFLCSAAINQLSSVSAETESKVDHRYLEQTLPCRIGRRFLEIDINADDKGEQTSVIMKRMTSDGSWAKRKSINQKGVTSNTVTTLERCIDMTKCYKIAIKDEAMNGICCEEGEGSYSVVLNGNTIKTSTFENGKKEMMNICCENVETPNAYSYRQIDSFDPSARSVTFSVDARNDAHIALGEDNAHNGDHYEIVLGCCGNTYSLIRGANQGDNLDVYGVLVLKAGEDRMFRISWNTTSLHVEQAIGRNWQGIMTFSGRDTSAYNWKIDVMMISTGFGSTGKWFIY